MFKESIVFEPEYEWNNLTEEQFKAMRNHILENYPERREGGIDCNLSCRGGELRSGWHFVLALNWVKYDNRCRTSSNLADTYIFLKEAIKEMRKVAWELEDIRVAME